MASEKVHVYPLNNVLKHARSVDCVCGVMQLKDNSNVIIHTAFDGRTLTPETIAQLAPVQVN